MSGAEFIAAAGVISSIIAIVDGIKQVVDAASEVEGLPKAFRQASNKLPLVSDILEATKHNFEADDVSVIERRVIRVVDDCEDKWKTLNDLFDKVIPEEKAPRVERYYKAVKTLGKGGKVENLMRGMLDDIQLLAAIKTMTTTNVEKVIKPVTAAQEDKVARAITDVAAWSTSVPDNIFQDGTCANINYGTSQNIAQGNAEQNNFQGEARQYHTGGGPLTISETQTIINIIQNYLLQSPKNNEAQACLTALFLTYPRDDRAKLIQSKGLRVDGTCEWIKTNEIYKSWLCSHSQLLWLSGSPGKGKTMLSIFLAEELERTAKGSQDVSFLEYFCDNKDEKRNTAVAIIRGMIFQLLDSSFETLWRIFESMLRDPVLGTIYCVLDGIDECEEASLEVLLKKFKALFSTRVSESSLYHLNLIVVSRDHPDFIPELLSGFPRIRLDADVDTQVNDDIYQFIKTKVNELSKSRQYPEPLRIHVEKVFQNRAQGTFLWVGIVAKALKKYKVTEVEKALDLFPSGLEELYARILLQIDDDRRKIAAKILCWVVMAVRPLTLSELSAAIEPAVKHPTILSSDEVIRDQVSYCGYFLTINEDKVGLIHQSAKDYLLRKTLDLNPKLEFFRIKEDMGHLKIAQKCLDYLQSGALAGGKVDLTMDMAHLEAFPLLSYAALHWYEHARPVACSADIFNLSLPFYDEESLRESWLKTYWDAKMDGSPPNSFTVLHLASCFGILPLAQNLLPEECLTNRLSGLNKTDVEAKDGSGQTALIWAARHGHKAVVQLLLEKGADIEAKGYGSHKTALLAAAEEGHEAVVRLLLEERADVEAKDGSEETALIRAAWHGHEAIVRLLLEKGADIKAESGWKTALFTLTAKAWKGGATMVRLLEEKAANVDASSKEGTALHIAVYNEDEAIVRLLLEKGADIEAKDRYRETALIQAAWHGCEAMVRLLLEKKADVNAKSSKGGTALHIAVYSEDEAIVRLLLEKGADVEAKDSSRATALILAALDGREAMVRLLLEKGGNGKTALRVAIDNQDEVMINRLLENGVNVEAKSSNGESVQDVVANNRPEVVARLLLGHGACIKVKTIDGKMAWYMATYNRDKTVVQLLTPFQSKQG